jgi:hypothetical protein
MRSCRSASSAPVALSLRGSATATSPAARPSTDGDTRAVDRACDTLPGLRRKVDHRAELDLAFLGTFDDGGGERMLATPFETGDEP